MSEYIYLNGKLEKAADAAIHPNDAGLLHGAGLFETMRAYNGRIFRLKSHLDRLLNSAAALGLPFTQAHLPSETDFQRLLEKNDLQDARCRLTVTTGPLQPESSESEIRPTVIASAAQQADYPAEIYQKGMAVTITTYQQNPHDPTHGHKTINYLPRLLALSQARQNGCGEALWFTLDKRLAEGSISNVFLVKAEVLKTPPVDTPVLPGIARATVIGAAAADGVTVSESPLTIDDLLDADEVFLTNSVMEVMPVTRIERKAVGSQKPGPVTGRLGHLYRRLVQQECPAP